MKKGFLLLSILLITSMLDVVKATNSNEGYTPRNQEGPSSEAYLHALRSNQNTGKILPSELVQAAQQVQSMSQLRSQTALNWHSLGPDNYGGKTKGIIYDNRDASGQTLYAGATGGGIWKSINDGITWNPVGNINLMVSCMVQTSDGVIYVGTGDGFDSHLYNGLNDMAYTTGFMGQGIWKSTDGSNFVQLTATAPQMNNNASDWAFVNELAVNSAGHIFASTIAGLKYSIDGGETWSLAKDADNNSLSMRSGDVQVGSDGTIIAAVDFKCYISKTGDPNGFTLRSTGEETALPAADVTRLEFAIAPSNPSVMYAVLANNAGAHIGVYRSGDKGETWTVILPATSTVSLLGTRGNYNNNITVFPDNPDRILVGGTSLWQGKKIVENGLFSWEVKSSLGGGFFNDRFLNYGQERVVFKPGSSTSIFVATDGGVHKGTIDGENYSFTQNNRNYITSQFYTIAPSGLENRVLAGAQDQGSIYISSTANTVRQGETVYSSNTSGGSCVFSTINPNAIVMSTVAGSMVRSEDLGVNYSTQFLLSSGMGNTQAYKTPVVLWESYEDQNSRDSVTFKARIPYSGGQVIKVKSHNYDHPFYHTLPANVNLNSGDTLRVKDIVSSKLFIAVANKLWMTKEFLNFGKTPEWFELSNVSVGFSGIPQSVAVSADGNHAFIGMRDGKLYRVSNIALAYNYERADVNSPGCIISTKQLTVNLPNTSTPISQAITSIAIDPTNPNNVLITLGNYGNDHYVFATANALSADPTFTSKQGNLPKMPVYSSLFELSNPGLVFLGTEYGIFRASNFQGVPDWTADQGALGTVPVFELKQQLINKSADTSQLINVDTLVMSFPGTNNYGIIYGATFGRGLYRCNDYRKPVGIEERPDSQTSSMVVSIYPNPIENQAWIDFEINQAGQVQFTIFDLSGRLIQNENLGYKVSGKHQIQISGNGLKAGTYILRMECNNQSKAIKFLVY